MTAIGQKRTLIKLLVKHKQAMHTDFLFQKIII